MSFNADALKTLLKEKKAEEFFQELKKASKAAAHFEDVLFCSVLRKKAITQYSLNPVASLQPLRIALVGGYTFYPLQELLEHQLFLAGFEAQFFVGDFNNYIPEVLNPQSALYIFKPELVVLVPSAQRISAEQSPSAMAEEILGFCKTINQTTGANVLLTNFVPTPYFDLGAFRGKKTNSDWNLKRQLNLQLALNAPGFVHICDAEFCAYRRGGLASLDERGWFESKQLGSPDFLVDLAREMVQVTKSLKGAPKKVLILDLDNTVWGGVIGDDGLEGIEVGDTSPVGEAYKAFQRAARALKDRGILLAACSKNEDSTAREPFLKHPEMVLKLEDFVAFKANWEPKSENIRAIAKELNLGLDSFVFVDDNPAEIEIVNQFVPEVETILMHEDPSLRVRQLADCRFFEPLALTDEDLDRTKMYQQEGQRKRLEQSVTNLDEFLKSLQMTSQIKSVDPIDVPRVTQLINRSNQFNLTTKRRSEAEVASLIENKAYQAFTVRLADRFGDHGLIAVVVTHLEAQNPKVLWVDTWLMSCRVLNRQVENETINTVFEIAKKHGCEKVKGQYIPTKKNMMVRDLYEKMGLKKAGESSDGLLFEANVEKFVPFETHIQVKKTL